MSKAESIKGRIQGLINSANRMTGETDSTLTTAVERLLHGYSAGGGGAAAINAGRMTYKTPDGATVAAGDFVELVRKWGSGGLYADAATAIAVAAMGDSRVMVVYTPKSNDQNGYAVLLSVDGPTVTASLPRIFNRYVEHSSIAAVSLGADKVLVAFLANSEMAGTADAHGAAVVLTADEHGAISTGAAFAFTNTTVANLTLTALSDSKAVVAYRDADNTGKAVVLTVDGTTVSAGIALQFDSNVRNPKLTTLSAGKVLVAYETYDWGANMALYGQAMAITVDGLTLTRGGAHTFKTSAVYYIDIAALSEDRAVVVYSESSDDDRPIARLLSISGRTVSSLTTAALDTGAGSSLAVTALGRNKALVVANVYTSRFEARAYIVTTSGTLITCDSVSAAFLTNSGAGAFTQPALIAFSETSALLVGVAGLNVGLTSRTHYRSISIDGSAVTVAPLDAVGGTEVVPITDTQRHSVGVTQTGGTGGALVHVYRAGMPAESTPSTSFTLYDGAVTVVEGEVIYFTLAFETYVAIAGMTWGEWIASAYNAAGAYIQDGSVRLNGRDVLEGTGSATEKTADLITAGGAYQLR